VRRFRRLLDATNGNSSHSVRTWLMTNPLHLHSVYSKLLILFIHNLYGNIPGVGVKISIREVPGSNLGPEIGYTD
jgi:hypothetical protein